MDFGWYACGEFCLCRCVQGAGAGAVGGEDAGTGGDQSGGQ